MCMVVQQLVLLVSTETKNQAKSIHKLKVRDKLKSRESNSNSRSKNKWNEVFMENVVLSKFIRVNVIANNLHFLSNCHSSFIHWFDSISTDFFHSCSQLCYSSPFLLYFALIFQYNHWLFISSVKYK